MPASQKILVVIDPIADAQPGLERAAWLAASTGAELELFVCDYDQYLASHPLFDSAGLEKARRSLLENHAKRLRKLAGPFSDRGLRVSVDARWGRPLHRGVVEKVRDSKPAMVVKDTHHHPALKRTLFSNTDWNLIRACPVPLMLVKPRDIGAPPKFLAAVDPMHELDKPAALDRAILAFAAELAAATGGELHVVHAVDTAPVLASASATTPVGMASVPIAELTAAVESEHRRALDELLAGFAVDAGRVHFEQGAPHQCLKRVAEEQHADFVVMGAVSRGALQRLFVGSTAERALDRLPCDLIVVKPEGFVSRDLD